MTPKLKKLMYISAIIDMIPWLLFSFTGVYTRIYLARHLDVDLFALSGMFETFFSYVVLQYLSNEKIIHFIKTKVVYISIFGSMLDILRAYMLPYYPAPSLFLGTFTGVVFCNIVSYGFKELVNKLFIHTDRTVYGVVCDKYGKLASFIAMLLAYFLKDLDINTVVIILIISNCLVVIGDFIQYKLLTSYKE